VAGKIDLNWRRFALKYKKKPEEIKCLHEEVRRCIKDMAQMDRKLDDAMLPDPAPPRHLNIVGHSD
jgi:hypothetical protein